MTNEELQRIGQYAAKIQGADGSLSVLAFDERQDLEMLIQKRLDESAAAEGSEGKHVPKG